MYQRFLFQICMSWAFICDQCPWWRLNIGEFMNNSWMKCESHSYQLDLSFWVGKLKFYKHRKHSISVMNILMHLSFELIILKANICNFATEIYTTYGNYILSSDVFLYLYKKVCVNTSARYQWVRMHIQIMHEPTTQMKTVHLYE